MNAEKEKLKIIFNIFWPLAISWLFMAVDNPSIAAIVSRMPQPDINLAAHGGIVYPIALIIEAPIIMMLSVSLAVCKGQWNFRRVYRFMMVFCALLSVFHVLMAFSSLFDWVVVGWIGAPEAVVPNARLGFMFIMPWTWSIGYRRFYQGILIRTGQSKKVTIGTFIRMMSLLSFLFICYFLREWIPGTVAGAGALSCGVLAEAFYIGAKGRVAARIGLPDGDSADLISWKELTIFVIPLILTQLVNFGWMSLGSAAMSRMVNPIASLALWPVLSGLLNIIRSFGNAVNETALTIVTREGYFKAIQRFTLYVGIFSSIIFGLMMIPMIGHFWFVNLSALSDELSVMAKFALPLTLFVPMANAYLNFYQAILLSQKKTRGFLEALFVFLLVIFSFMGVGIALQRWEGIYVIMLGMNFAVLSQMAWTQFRAGKYVQALKNA